MFLMVIIGYYVFNLKILEHVTKYINNIKTLI